MKFNSKILPIAASFAILSIAISSPASAQTTTDTDPDSVLASFENGIEKMDDIGGAAAAVGMASAIFGGAALIFKRFIYS